MKLLIITQKIDANDDILGFFHRWVEEFAKRCQSVIAICLQKGEYDLPENVKVLSLGKEEGSFQSCLLADRFSIFKRIKYIVYFYRYIFRERKNYDAVFVHMNPEYVVLGGLFWRIWKKKIGLWYVHRQVDLKLRLAAKLVDKIFTASKESFRLPSKKVEIVGHGIDVNKFKIQNSKFKTQNSKLKTQNQKSKFSIITAGRISRIKNLDILIKAAGLLKSKFGRDFEVLIAGKPITKEDEIYFNELRKLIEKQRLNDIIQFAGPVPYRQISEFYQKADLFINLSDTGSIDKAVLEAMANSLLVLTSNEAFKKILPAKYLAEKNPEKIAERIIFLSREKPDGSLEEYVIKNHNLENLAEKIITYFNL